MLLNWLGLLTISFFNGVAYRSGGSGNYPRYFRPLGIGLCTILAMWLVVGFHWSIILCGGLMSGASTTYLKKKGAEAHWFNWLFVGLMFSIAVLPWVISTGHWLGFGIRTLVCTGLITLWSQLIGWDILEEFGRGFISIATLGLLIIK